MKITYTEKPGVYTSKKTGKTTNITNVSVRVDTDVILVNFQEDELKAMSSGEILAHLNFHSLWLHRSVERIDADIGMVVTGYDDDHRPIESVRKAVLVATCDNPNGIEDYIPLYDADNGKVCFNPAANVTKYEPQQAASAADIMSLLKKKA